MKFKVTYAVPFSPDPELRTQVFEEEITATDTQSVRRGFQKISKRHNSVIGSDGILLK